MKKIIAHKGFWAGLLLSSAQSLAQENSLGLKQALEQASITNKGLQIQKMEVEKSGEVIGEVKGLLKPVVEANGTYQIFSELPVIYLRNDQSSKSVQDVKYGGYFAFSGNISARYPLINPNIHSRIKQAKLQEQRARLGMADKGENLAYEITRTYLDILFNQKQQEVMWQSRLRNKKAQEDARLLFLQGKALKSDTLSHFLVIQNIDVALMALETERLNAFARLNRLMGTPDSITYLLTDTIDAENDILLISNEISAAGSALPVRNDYKILQNDIEQQREGLKQVKSEYRPRLWALAGYQIQSQTDDFAFWNAPVPRTSFAGVSLSIPIYSGNRQKYQLRQQEFNIMQKELALEELTEEIVSSLKQLEREFNQARHALRTEAVSVHQAQVNYQIVFDRYKMGIASRLELNDAELALTEARLKHIQSAFNIRLLYLDWKKATGQLNL